MGANDEYSEDNYHLLGYVSACFYDEKFLGLHSFKLSSLQLAATLLKIPEEQIDLTKLSSHLPDLETRAHTIATDMLYNNFYLPVNPIGDRDDFVDNWLNRPDRAEMLVKAINYIKPKLKVDLTVEDLNSER